MLGLKHAVATFLILAACSTLLSASEHSGNRNVPNFETAKRLLMQKIYLAQERLQSCCVDARLTVVCA